MEPQYGIEWDRKLLYRAGGANLASIQVYHDFNWTDVCGHNRSEFRRGLDLAQMVTAECPDTHAPALLLTERDDVPEGPLFTDERYFFVVNLPRYLKSASANAAVSYYAGVMRTELERLRETQATLEERPDLVINAMNLGHIAEWIAENPERIEEIKGLLSSPSGNGETDLGEIVAALSALDELHLDEDLVQEFLAAFQETGHSKDRRVALLRLFTGDPEGRALAGEIVAQRTVDRIRDARSSLAAYKALLNEPGARETEVQTFIEANLWLLGLQYGRARPGQAITGGETDFLLERFDGYIDLLELKSPQDRIILTQGDPENDSAPRPSSFSLSRDLAKAFAQVHAYRDRLTRYANVNEDLYGLSDTRDPRIFIIIGRYSTLNEHEKRVLRELNKSMHRVEVIPYDLLAVRATFELDNVEKLVEQADMKVESGT